ncbi:hypothetical protein E2320_012891 [Naja naja]|nr:hypothetical protein E2320_012891 [Naja naja]
MDNRRPPPRTSINSLQRYGAFASRNPQCFPVAGSSCKVRFVPSVLHREAFVHFRRPSISKDGSTLLFAAAPRSGAATIKNIGLVLVIIGAVCLCIWIAFVTFHFRDRTEMIMLDKEPPEMAFELPAPGSVDPPMPGSPPAASGNPDPASLGPEESQRLSELSRAVADSPDGSGSPMDEETIPPAVLLEGNLERDKAVLQPVGLETGDAGVLLMEGEQCNKWVPGKASPIETFQCPTQDNQREEMFCCGTCTASYCCSSTKEHLDQASCSKIIKKTDDNKAALFAVTPPKTSSNNTRLVLAVIGVSCICVWIAMVVSYFQDQKITPNQQRPVHEQLDISPKAALTLVNLQNQQESGILSQFCSSKHKSYFGVNQDPHPPKGLIIYITGFCTGSAVNGWRRTAGAGRSDTCRLGPYGTPLLDASEECSLHRAPRSPTSPGKTRAADPPAKESSRFWIRLGASAQEVSHFPTDPPEDGVLMEGEQCNKWVDGQVNPIETFHCPTQDNQQEMFCCGTCTASYCCSSIKERLDQASCPKAEDQKPEDSVGPTDRVAQRVANAQLDLVRGIPTASVTDSPEPGRAASVAPDPPSSVPEESQSSSELPTAVVNAPGGSGNGICEVTTPPLSVPGEPLGVVPGEEEEEEETYF